MRKKVNASLQASANGILFISAMPYALMASALTERQKRLLDSAKTSGISPEQLRQLSKIMIAPQAPIKPPAANPRKSISGTPIEQLARPKVPGAMISRPPGMLFGPPGSRNAGAKRKIRLIGLGD